MDDRRARPLVDRPAAGRMGRHTGTSGRHQNGDVANVSDFSEMHVDPLRGALVLSPTTVTTVEQTHRLLTHGTRRRIVFRHHMGARKYDVIPGGFVAIRLIHERVASLLEPFTGWKSFRIELYDREGDRVEGYVGLTVTGRVGPIDWSTAQVLWHQPHTPGLPWFQVARGYSLDQATWDGSDLCVPAGSATVLVSPAVRQTLVQAKVRPLIFKLIPETERTWDVPGLPKLAKSDTPPGQP